MYAQISTIVKLINPSRAMFTISDAFRLFLYSQTKLNNKQMAMPVGMSSEKIPCGTKNQFQILLTTNPLNTANTVVIIINIKNINMFAIGTE